MRPVDSVALAVGIVVLQSASSRPPSVSAIVNAATAYVSTYQQQLTSVVADEEYSQDVEAQTSPDTNALRSSRLMKSEVFFMFTPAERHWMTIRDVQTVDGQTPGERHNVRQLLETMPAERVGSGVKASNSRWNIGRIIRNFNEPTLSLLVLDQEHVRRFKFERKGVEITEQGGVATVAFVEKARPTLISGVMTGPTFSRGQFVIETASGRVRHGVLRAEADGVRVELTTEYGPNEKLGIWVPLEFREVYERGREGRAVAEYERVRTAATYTNYRRFDVVTRVK
jgi:hypothetical protein